MVAYGHLNSRFVFFMTKEEVKNNLIPHRNRFDDNKQWRDAFKIYNDFHGTTLKPNCGRCFEKVREWLER